MEGRSIRPVRFHTCCEIPLDPAQPFHSGGTERAGQRLRFSVNIFFGLPFRRLLPGQSWSWTRSDPHPRRLRASSRGRKPTLSILSEVKSAGGGRRP